MTTLLRVVGPRSGRMKDQIQLTRKSNSKIIEKVYDFTYCKIEHRWTLKHFWQQLANQFPCTLQGYPRIKQPCDQECRMQMAWMEGRLNFQEIELNWWDLEKKKLLTWCWGFPWILTAYLVFSLLVGWSNLASPVRAEDLDVRWYTYVQKSEE